MICLIEYLVLVQILLSGSQSAADMTLGFIHIQYLPRLLCQRRIHLGQPLRHVLMYRAFADAEGLGSLPYRGVVVDDIARYPYSSFFNIVFQRKTPQDTFLQCMKVSEGLCILTIKPLFDNYFVSKYNSCTLQVSILNIREVFFVKESKLRLRSAGLLSVAAGFMLFLYAPLEIYFNNKYEFWFDFYDLIPLCLLMFAVFTGVSFLLAFIVSKINTRLYHGFLTVYLIAFLCTYIQGNFMIGNLPHLDGSTVDWAQYSGLRIGSVALWVAVAVLVILTVKKLSLTKVADAAGAVSGLISLVLLVTLVTLGFTKQGLEHKFSMINTTYGELEMSTDQNLVLLVLDTVDGDIMSQVIEHHPEYKETLSDFTYYNNTMSAYPFTA